MMPWRTSVLLQILILISLSQIRLGYSYHPVRSVPLTLPNATSSSTSLYDNDDPRFSMQFIYGENDVPITPVFMNVVELMARYAEMDFRGRTGQRQGVVLPSYPQVEIAIIPAPPATSVPVRLVIWGLYSAVVDRVVENKFKDVEIVLLWSNRPVGYMYFTTPAEDDLGSSSESTHAFDPIILNSTASISQIPNTTYATNNTLADAFAWTPMFRPNGKSLLAKDVFIMCMAVIKSIAPQSPTDKVESPFHVQSELVNANLQIWFHRRRVPRTKPPYLEYGLVLDVARRIPAWMLLERRFAEAFFSVFAYGKPVGHLLIERGPFNPGVLQLDSES